jgi:hypothetical protein
VFLLLATWKSLVPALALEVAVGSHHIETNNPISVEDALDELEALSMIQVVQVDDEAWVDVPLPAWLFGRRKLITDPERVDVEQEAELLQLFGPTAATDLRHGLIRPARRFWDSVRGRISDSTWLTKW